jgi:hypothetical protein
MAVCREVTCRWNKRQNPLPFLPDEFCAMKKIGKAIDLVANIIGFFIYIPE